MLAGRYELPLLWAVPMVMRKRRITAQPKMQRASWDWKFRCSHRDRSNDSTIGGNVTLGRKDQKVDVYDFPAIVPVD